MEDRANILRQMKVCRFCLSSEEQGLSNIHEKDVQKSDPFSISLPVLPIQVMACIAIEVVKNDNMPQYICKTCRHLTAQAYIFKTNCKKADDALKLFLVTGQLSKPYLQKVADFKVQPVAEKTLTVPENRETEKYQTFIEHTEGGNEMEFEIINEDEESVAAIQNSDTNARPKPAVAQVKTDCYSCPECDRSFPLKQLLDLHMGNHSREKKFECDTCHTKYYSKYDLQKHILNHNQNKEFSCVVCKKTFAREPLLRKHEKTHVNVPKYVCLQCDKTFLTKEYLEFHMEKHNKKRPFTCNVCNKSFVFKQGLERHEVVHSENKPHKCNYCDASFTSAIKLTRHITSHAGLRPYPCKLCGRTFLLSHHLTRHMRSHYSSTTSLDSVGQHKCDICSMSFRRKDSLINHSAIHSMVNLKCVICNTTFETAAMVKEHITTHLTGLPFPCEKCDYSFETSDQLEQHELKHAEMEYEDQIEKEVFSESINQQDQEQDNDEDDEVEEGEVREYTIVDVNNPEAGLRRMDDTTTKNDLEGPRIEFLKDELSSEEDQDAEAMQGEEIEEEVTEPIKPVIRQEGTKMYQRRDTPTKAVQDIRLSSLKAAVIEKQQQLIHQQPTTLSEATLSGKKVGDKIVKIQKFILTKDEMKAMAKQGILEIKNGQVMLKSGGQQILNATLKPIQKNEIDSLLDKRQSGGKFEIKKYDKKSSSAESVAREET